MTVTVQCKSILRLKICSVVLHPGRKPACSSSMIFSASGFRRFGMIFSLTLLGWLIRLMVRKFWNSCKLPFFGRVMTRDWVHGVGHSPVRQILLQIISRALTMASPLCLSSYVGILSSPADFPFFSDFTAASTSSRRMG